MATNFHTFLKRNCKAGMRDGRLVSEVNIPSVVVNNGGGGAKESNVCQRRVFLSELGQTFFFLGVLQYVEDQFTRESELESLQAETKRLSKVLESLNLTTKDPIMFGLEKEIENSATQGLEYLAKRERDLKRNDTVLVQSMLRNLTLHGRHGKSFEDGNAVSLRMARQALPLILDAMGVNHPHTFDNLSHSKGRVCKHGSKPLEGPTIRKLLNPEETPWYNPEEPDDPRNHYVA